MAISQTLHTMFPIAAFPEVEKIPMLKFISRVLVPEATWLLIQDDRQHETEDQALVTLKESSLYGVEMYGYIDGENSDDESAMTSRTLATKPRPLKRKIEWVDPESDFEEDVNENKAIDLLE